MQTRDFSKSVKSYFGQNRIFITLLVGLLVIGAIVLGFFGMNGNFEFTGYYEFYVYVGSETSDYYTEFASEISDLVDAQGGEYYSYSIYDEGDDTRLVIKYLNKLTTTELSDLGSDISTKLYSIVGSNFDAGDNTTIFTISEQSYVSGTVRAVDYLYCAVVIVLIMIVSAFFAKFRYNTASAFTIILSCLLGTLSYLALTAILRLSVGISYFAMLVILNALIVYFAFDFFENIHETTWLNVNDYASAYKHGMQSSRFKNCFLAIAVEIIGLLFVIFGTSAIKTIALNIMFLAVALLFVSLYIMPFCWSMFIVNFNNNTAKTANVKEGKNKPELSKETESSTQSDKGETDNA